MYRKGTKKHREKEYHKLLEGVLQKGYTFKDVEQALNKLASTH